MTPQDFVHKWISTQLSERAASHEHFTDLCRLINQPTPAEADPRGFEKPVTVVGPASKGTKDDHGFVDFWKQGCIAWEDKRKDKYKSLDEAYRQVYQYRDALDNPPLSIACDIPTTEIRTHFPGYPTENRHRPERNPWLNDGAESAALTAHFFHCGSLLRDPSQAHLKPQRPPERLGRFDRERLLAGRKSTEIYKVYTGCLC
jgi:hypothetical protein